MQPITSVLRCSPESFGVDPNKKTTFHVHLPLLIDLGIALPQLHGEILVLQFMHNALTMHQVVDEQKSFHR